MRTVITLGKSHDECFQGDLADIIPYHRMNGKEYCVPAFIAYQEAELSQLREASEGIHRIYWKVLRFTQNYLPDSFIEQYLGVDSALIPLARLETPSHGIARLDWIVNEHGMKCIENNSDTPTGVPETAYAANALLNLFNSMNNDRLVESDANTSTSSDMPQLIGNAFAQLVEFYRAQGADGSIVFTSYDWHVEDAANTQYIMTCLQNQGYEASYVPLAQLELIPGEGLYANGQRIGILYRLYPLEYIVHDVDNTGSRNIGLDLLQLVEQGKLSLINPGQSILMQSKGFMALIWSLYERREETEQYCGFQLLSDEDIAVIETYLLPTYFENSVFEDGQLPYVAKGLWGREGKGTMIYAGSEKQAPSYASQSQPQSSQIDEQELDYYNNQRKIYQRYFPLEKVEIMTEDGPYRGYLLTGAFVIGGKFAGLLPRVGEQITGDMAYYCPALVQN